jgi:hypothetical protein
MIFLDSLNFKPSPIKYVDGRKQVDATLKGKFTIEEVSDNINALAKSFNSKDVYMGVACHYKKINRWVPALISQTSGKIKVWNPDEYPDSGYYYDKIDCIQVFIIESKGYADVHKMLKPKKSVIGMRKSDFFGK